MALRIGIDFDNTIVCYDDAFVRMARSENLVSASFRGCKADVRDFVRRLADGEEKWQRLQGKVYAHMDDAGLFDGVEEFLRRCRQRDDISVFIVSHKTEFGHSDSSGLNLRKVACDWMTKQGFFEERGFRIPVENLYFESTRDDKIERIARLGCTHFIDDLEEVLEDSRFPAGVRRILFLNRRRGKPAVSYDVCADWREIQRVIFANAD